MDKIQLSLFKISVIINIIIIITVITDVISFPVAEHA
uniref:Uncharacterized protein n=1 Tax=Anguilla anguilla TaxID=7936 RepID=A0A0E9Q0J0_ANGAN